MNPPARVLFGYFPIPEANTYSQILEQAMLADELGLDLIAVQDHPYQWRFLDALTLLTAIAVQTRRVRVLPDVVNLQLRPPAVLAKVGAPRGVLTGCRGGVRPGAGRVPP